MLIPEEKVQEILERTDIAALVAARVELKRAGRSLKGLCPFHGERTPSFTVNLDRRRFKCFGCGVGGDAIAFVMKSDGKSFVEAARELADRAGVRLDDAGDDGLQREKLNQRRVHELATRFFQEKLWDRTGGLQARTFLKKRGLTAETVKAFALGFAPTAWSEFSARAAKEGMLELALSAGLINERGRQASGPQRPATSSGPQAPEKAARTHSSTYDFFRGRLMIPIRNAEGATVAFGGRILEGDDPRKFINSRESLIYKKGELLYGIDQAGPAIRKTGQALLVEGYFDAIVLHQAGLTNAVALCSASLTPEQVKLLQRFDARELVLLLDGDDAGRRGVARAAGALLAAAMPTRVMVLPTGKDPDDYVLEVGAERFRKELAEALPLTEHLVRAALPQNDSGANLGYEARLKGLSELKPILAQIPEGLERALFLKTLSERLGIPEATLTTHLRGQVPQAKPADPRPEPATGAPPAGRSPVAQARPAARAPARPAAAQRDRLLPEEALLFAHLLHDAELARLPQAEELEHFAHQGLRAAASAYAQATLDGKPLGREETLAALDPLLRKQIEELLARVTQQPPQAHREEFLQRCALHKTHIARAETDEMQARIRELGTRIADLKKRGAGGPDLEALNEEHLKLTEEKQALAKSSRSVSTRLR
jgi:DNA primase